MPTSSTKSRQDSSTTLLAAVGVRALLISHNILTVWRVVLTRNDKKYWGLLVANSLTLAEGAAVIRRNGGIEWKWQVYTSEQNHFNLQPCHFLKECNSIHEHSRNHILLTSTIIHCLVCSSFDDFEMKVCLMTELFRSVFIDVLLN